MFASLEHESALARGSPERPHDRIVEFRKWPGRGFGHGTSLPRTDAAALR